MQEESNLEYDYLCEVGRIRMGGYVIQTTDASLITLKHHSFEESPISTRGWKFHVSIDDRSQENIKRACEEIAKILMREGVVLAKFEKCTISSDDVISFSERGRQITIYARPQGDASVKWWKNLLSSITMRLVELGIPPGYCNAVSKKVSQSEYISYRNDCIGEEQYVACREVYYDNEIEQDMKYNPGNEEDKFIGLTIDVADQLPMRRYEVARNCCLRCNIL